MVCTNRLPALSYGFRGESIFHSDRIIPTSIWSEEIITVWNDQRKQTFDITVPDTVEELGFDEGAFILKVLK